MGLIYFGLRSLKDAWDMPAGKANDELEDAVETVDQAAVGQGSRNWRTVLEVSSLVFAAEWGDRSMLAIIALAASGGAAVPVGVGALSGHFAAISVAIGVVFKHVPDVFTSSIPVAEYIAVT